MERANLILARMLKSLHWQINDFPDNGAPTQRWGYQPIILPNVTQKLHEYERNWT